MTTTFQLDTTGYVDVAALGIFKLPGHIHAQTTVQWSDLSPFTQGYIGALLLALDEQRMAHYQDRRRRSLPEAVPVRPAFSWLAPETLARIIADCEAFAPGPHPDLSPSAYGREFWYGRANGFSVWSVDRADYASRFPPLTVTLGDDVKVRFA